jgi:hypothetical protein
MTIAKIYVALGLIPRVVVYRQIASRLNKYAQKDFLTAIPTSNASTIVPISQEHTCGPYIDMDLDGHSLAYFCDLCSHQLHQRIAKLSNQCHTYIPDQAAQAAEKEILSELNASKSKWKKYYESEKHFLAQRDFSELISLDIEYNVNRDWIQYMELSDPDWWLTSDEKFIKSFTTKEDKLAAIKDIQARKEAEAAVFLAATQTSKHTMVSTIQMPHDVREYIRSVDKRKGDHKETEFQEWLAIPKNKRPIYLQGGKKGPAVAKADIGSVVIKSCPPTVLLSDIRLVLARFGGVRDVYRPKDRVTGKPKPFVFVEMLRNQDAWTAVDYFAKQPFILDDHTFIIEGAGERKTSAEMAVLYTSSQSSEDSFQPIHTSQPKNISKSTYTGVFSALIDSDSDTD